MGYADETWWSRVAPPSLHAWADGPLRLVEQTVARDDPDPKALACFGLLLQRVEEPEAVWLRFVDGRPVSALTTAFLAWCCEQLAAQGITPLVLVWDNASWHISLTVRRWLREQNQRAHRQGGVRLVPCLLPTRSPWLNPIEPKWVHGKRRILEPARLLTAAELEDRICAAFASPRCDHLAVPKEVA